MTALFLFLCYISAMAILSETLRERGYIHQFSSETLEEITDGPRRVVYLGVDPTADSLHVGNLAAYMLLRRFAEAGHKAILLMGGGTGMIGDPKPDGERLLIDLDTISARIKKLKTQSKRLLGSFDIEVVNNADWLMQLDLVGFLRDVGKYFTVNALVKKDAISARMKSQEGISFTEFSYPLLQAYDFWYLFKHYNCDVQIGGSDQWGNIIAGVDLIRRKEGALTYALTLPIITEASGKKFGKSEGNAIWLDPTMTSPFAFYQFWINTSDENVESYLKLFTFLSIDEIAAAMELHARNPKERHAQKILAREVTRLVHGHEAEQAEAISAVLFDATSIHSVDAHLLEALWKAAPSWEVREGMPFVDALVGAQLARSRREARQFIVEGAVTLNGGEISDPTRRLEVDDFVHRTAIVRCGRRSAAVLILV